MRGAQVLQRLGAQEGVRRPGVDRHRERHRAGELAVEDVLRLHDGRPGRELVQGVRLRRQPADLRRGRDDRQRKHHRRHHPVAGQRQQRKHQQAVDAPPQHPGGGAPAARPQAARGRHPPQRQHQRRQRAGTHRHRHEPVHGAAQPAQGQKPDHRGGRGQRQWQAQVAARRPPRAVTAPADVVAHVNRVIAEQPAREHRRQDQQRGAGTGQQHEQRAARRRRARRRRQRHQHTATAAEREQQNRHRGCSHQRQQCAQVAHHQPPGQLHHRLHAGVVQCHPVLLGQPALQRVEALHEHRRRPHQPRTKFQVERGGPEVGAPVGMDLREPLVGCAQLRRHPPVIPLQQRRGNERTHHDIELGGAHHGGAQRRGVTPQTLHGPKNRVHLRQDRQIVRIQPVAGTVAEVHPPPPPRSRPVTAAPLGHPVPPPPRPAPAATPPPPAPAAPPPPAPRPAPPAARPRSPAPRLIRRLHLRKRCAQRRVTRHGHDLVSVIAESDPHSPERLILPPMHSSAVNRQGDESNRRYFP